MQYALIQGTVVKELFASLPDFHPDIMAQIQQVTDDVQVGMEQQPDGTFAWPAPAPVDTEALRRAAYRDESDPLFFKYQRDEGTKQAWLDAVAAIKLRYPS